VTTWDAAPQIPPCLVHPPVDPHAGRWMVVDEDGRTFHHVAANGYEMLVAYLAGPANLAWSSGRMRGMARVTTYTSDGRKVTHTETHTAEDIETLEEDLSHYLMDAEVPPPPRGREWYLSLPRGIESTSHLYRIIDDYIGRNHPTSVDPREVRRGIEEIVQRTYSESTGGVSPWGRPEPRPESTP
jgi:Family of unknown function (DUF5956)